MINVPVVAQNQVAHVFTYGSLMYPDIFEQVTASLPRSIPAIAHHWRRYGLANRSYPGAMPSKKKACRIEGVLWFDVSEIALAALDRFEADEYRRATISVTTQDGQLCSAYIYEWLFADQIQGEWSRAEFEQYHRGRFVQIHGHQQD